MEGGDFRDVQCGTYQAWGPIGSTDRIDRSEVLSWLRSNGEARLHEREMQEAAITREDESKFRLVEFEAPEGHLGDDSH